MRNVVVFAAVLAAMLFLCGAVLAAESAATPSQDSPLKGILKGALTGAVSGMTVAWLGFMKDKDPAKKWDFQFAAPTMVIGLIVGCLMGWQRKDLSKIDDWWATAAAVLPAELLAKAGWRNTQPVVSKIVGSVLHRPSA